MTFEGRARRLTLAACALLALASRSETVLADITFRGPADPRSSAPGTERVPVRIERGQVYVEATLESPSGRSASGRLILDTGAPGLTVGMSTWTRLQVDTIVMGSWSWYQRVRRPLSSIEMGGARIRGLSIAGVVADSLLEPGVIGLLGPSEIQDRGLVLDYARSEWAIVSPRLAVVTRDSASGGNLGRETRVKRSRAAYSAVLGPDAVAVPFRLFEGGRILVDARACEPDAEWCGASLTLLFDTGASTCVFFDDMIAERVARARTWPKLHNVSLHTMLGTSQMAATVVPRLHLVHASPPLSIPQVDAGIAPRAALPEIEGTLPERIHGLLGNTFLERFRVILDYGNQVLWVESRPNREPRAFASSHVGLRLERRWGAVRVASVARGSAAAAAGITAGDVVLAIDGFALLEANAEEAESRLEGAPGSEVVLLTRHEGLERVQRLQRTSRP